MLKKFFDFSRGTGKYNIRSIQTFIDLEKSKSIKESMLSDNYDFTDKKNMIAYYFINDKYIISEGNHRMHAALSIWKETDNYIFVEKLIKNGLKYSIDKEPLNFRFKL